MKWITIAAIGDSRQVKCSECGYKVTYHGDKTPKRCLSCRAVPDAPKMREGSLRKFPTLE